MSVSSDDIAKYSADALTRFCTAMAAKGVEPSLTLVAMWTVCATQLRKSGYSAKDMADLLVMFQKTYRIKSTN